MCHTLNTPVYLHIPISTHPYTHFYPCIFRYHAAITVNTVGDVIDLLRVADVQRSSRGTDMNVHSSRSHMMLTVTVTTTHPQPGSLNMHFIIIIIIIIIIITIIIIIIIIITIIITTLPPSLGDDHQSRQGRTDRAGETEPRRPRRLGTSRKVRGYCWTSLEGNAKHQFLAVRTRCLRLWII